MEFVAITGVFLLLFALVLWLAFKHGKAVEKQSGADTQIKAVQDAKKVEDNVGKLDGLAVHDRLSKWRK